MRGQQGQSLVLVALLLVVLLGFAALAVDVGLLMVGKARLQVALDAAVLAAAQELPDTGEADAAFSEYVGANFPVSALFPAPVLHHSYSTSGGGVSLNTITADGAVTAPLHFARVLGLGSATIASAAAAANVDPDLALIIDRSGSMCEDYPGQGGGPTCPGLSPGVATCRSGYDWQPMTDVQGAAMAFVDRMGADTMMAVVSYNHAATVNYPLSDIGAYAGAVKASIDSIAPCGYTGIDSAIHAAASALLGSGRRNPR